MRNVLYLMFLALLFAACSGTKEIQMGQLNQEPCKEQITIKDKGEFVGETVENLNVYQQGDNIMASMDVRTMCDARLSFEPQLNKKLILLKLRNNNVNGSKCVCFTKVTTTFSSPGSGDYKVRVMNAAGNVLLAEQTATIK